MAGCLSSTTRRDKFEKAKYRVTNWPEYSEALRQRGDATVWFSEDAVFGWCAPRSGKRGGQRRYSDLAIETCLDPARRLRPAASENAGVCTKPTTAHADRRSRSGFFHALPAHTIASDHTEHPAYERPSDADRGQHRASRSQRSRLDADEIRVTVGL